MNAGEVVLAGVRDFGARWKDLVAAVAIALVPLTVIGLAVVAATAPEVVMDAFTSRSTPGELEASFHDVSASEWVRFGVAYGVFALVSGVANAVAFGACLAVAREHVRGRDLGYREALSEGLKRSLSVIWLFLLSAIPIAIGLVLCLLPGLWLIVSWLAAPVVLFHEELKGRRALGRSFRLVRPVFWATVLVALLEFVGLGVLQSAASSLVWVLPSPADAVSGVTFFAVMLFSALAGLVTMALHACIATRLYLALASRSAPLPALGES